jgi:hypothetical protein
MVEMRWLKKTEVLVNRPDDSPLVEVTTEVLQYRRHENTEWGIRWSDWIDVPTVTEP